MSGILSNILHGLSSFNNLKKTKTNLNGLKLPPPPPHHRHMVLVLTELSPAVLS